MSKEKTVVTIYSKPGCHLCDEAKDALFSSRCRDRFDLREINIEEDAELFEKYKFEIPVIFIGDWKAFKYRITEEEFCNRLQNYLTKKNRRSRFVFW